jgi:hypothetical protein
MKNFIYVLITLFLLYNGVYSQNDRKYFGDKTYVFENSKWFVLDKHTSDKFQINSRSLTVKLLDGLNENALSTINESHGVIINNSNKLGFIDLELPEKSEVFEIYNAYKNSGFCEIVEINSYGKALGTPNDPYSGSTDQYYLNHSTRPDINAPEAWDLWTGNSSVIITVLDDGIKLNP